MYVPTLAPTRISWIQKLPADLSTYRAVPGPTAALSLTVMFDPIPDDPITRGPRRETAVRRLLPCLAERIDLGLLSDHAIGPLGGVVPELLLGHGLGPGRLLEGRPEGGGGPGHVLEGGGEKEKEGGRGVRTSRGLLVGRGRREGKKKKRTRRGRRSQSRRGSPLPRGIA